MDRERAEAYLRMLAETERRRVTALPADSAAGEWHSPRLALVSQALCAVGAADAGVAEQIQADLTRAVAARQRSLLNATGPGPGGLSPAVRGRLERLMVVQPARAATGASPVSGASGGRTAARQASWRVVPVGEVIQIRNDDVGRELLLVAYVQSAGGARFTMAGWPFRSLDAVDDRGVRYRVGFRGGTGEGVLLLCPDPQHEIGWLDLTTTPGEPATRIDLDPPDSQFPVPDVTLTRRTASPGELLLNVVAARILTAAPAFPLDNPEQLAAAQADLRAFVADGPGDIVAALHAADALPPDSPLPGQLAGLCARLGIRDHGITAPPADELPEPWQSMLTRYHRPEPQAMLAPGSIAATVAELPELDSARITILGLHHGDRGTRLHLLADGVRPEAGSPKVTADCGWLPTGRRAFIYRSILICGSVRRLRQTRTRRRQGW